MDNTVADGIGKNWVPEFVTKARHIKLRAKYGGCLLVPGLNDLEQDPRLRIPQRREQLYSLVV